MCQLSFAIFIRRILLCYNLFMGKYKGYTEARERANEKYRKEKIDTLLLRMPKGKKAEIQEAATAAGLSVNQYCSIAIQEKLQRDNVADSFLRSDSE